MNNLPDIALPPEADITINGETLTFGQAMTVRVALESFASHLIENRLGEDDIGKNICRGYLDRISEIRKFLYR